MASISETMPARLERAEIRYDLAALLLPAVAIYALFFIWPLIDIFRASLMVQGKLSLGAYVDFFQDGFLRSVLWRTIRISIITTIATLIVGYPTALYLSQPWRKGRSFVTFFVIAPMLVSAVVRSYGWIIILGPNGLLSKALQMIGFGPAAGQLLYTETGVVIALTHVFLPFMVLSITGSLQQIDPALSRAARILGANEIKTFWRVVLPLSLPGITAGSMIVFCLAASGFVTPALVGGARVPVMPYIVYKEGLLVLNWTLASAVAVILLLTTALVTAVYMVWANRRTARFAGAAR
jgi:putative spermidine/putrescine transport system permease protein